MNCLEYSKLCYVALNHEYITKLYTEVNCEPVNH